MKIKESLNVTFDETPPPSKTSPLVDDALDEIEAIRVTEKKNLEYDIEDETLKIDEVVNIKESRNHPLENASSTKGDVLEGGGVSSNVTLSDSLIFMSARVKRIVSRNSVRVAFRNSVDEELIQAARDRPKSYADLKRKPMDFQVHVRVMLKVSPWKGVVRFSKRGKLKLRYIGPFKVLSKVGDVAYRLELPQQLSRVHNTMTSLADKAILSGANNRPPMLEKDMYDSWKSRMELYMLNRQHGRMILEFVENGPLLWLTVEENRVTRSKKYFELSATEAIQFDCDVKATNIILQGLPPEVYALVSTPKVAKEL
nr:reverse transcriptase domain-containing protein [Tanacetum cinerariifolium]